MLQAVTGPLAEALTQFVAQYGLVAVFLLMTAESALIPLPSEITMPFSGFMSSQGLLPFWGCVAAGATGNLAGSLIAWRIGLNGEEAVRSLVRTRGKYVLVSERELDLALRFYRRYGSWITFFSRLLPVIRTYISLPAGIAEMPIWRFSVLTLLGSLLWSTFLAWLGVLLGENWSSLHAYFEKADIALVGLVVLAIVLYVVYKLRG
ncbi:MAG TPA: DedA family protein [Chloroflexota bacterium]